MPDIINGYKMVTQFTNRNAGMCQWGFAEKKGESYFIKRLLTPKYPMDTKDLSPAQINAMRSSAQEFYETRGRYYAQLRECKSGNVVAAVDFFREGPFFYVVTPRIEGPFLSLREIAALTEDRKRVLIKSTVFSVKDYHARGIVHSDLKPDNVMVRQTVSGFCTAKLIDFESGFFENALPEEIEGDQVYFSPEAIRRNDEEDVPVTRKSDIFALGLILHQFCCGELPRYDKQDHYPAIALLNDHRLTLHPSVPYDLAWVILKMLDIDPDNRPSAEEVWNILNTERPLPEETTSSGFSPMDDDDL